MGAAERGQPGGGPPAGLHQQVAPPAGGGKRMKRAPKEKECRALMVSRLRHNSTSSRRSSSNKVARLPQPITARDRGSRKVGRKDNQKKRHRHGRNNFGAITPAAPERENSGAAFFRTRFLL